MTKYRTLFSLPFVSEMGDDDCKLLVSLLHLNLCLHQTMRWQFAQLGFATLDRDSGLYLLKQEDKDNVWILEARTYGSPPDQFVRRWKIEATDVVRRINPDGAFWPEWS